METPSEPSPRATVIAFLLVAAAILGGILLLLATRPAPVRITIIPPQPTQTRLPEGTPAPITIYVTGAVLQPGAMLTLPPDSRVADAVQAAGGAASDADLALVNMAGVLRDGDQVHVPRLGEANPALPTPGGGAVVRVNTATFEELEALPGVGPVLAQAILDYRAANGDFVTLEDLDAVEGIGPQLLENLAPLIAFD